MATRNTFIFASKSGRKISLDHTSHPCPRCHNPASVRLVRSERQLVLLNRRIKDSNSVRYECGQCRWRNTELPTETSMAHLQRYLSLPSSSSHYSI